MGDSRAGLWLIGCVAYFFVFYIVVISVIYMTAHAGVDNSDLKTADPGFQTQLTPLRPGGGVCGGSLPIASGSCAGIELADNDNLTCLSIEGCSWSSIIGCYGIVKDGNGAAVGHCSNTYNESFCKLLECTWTSFDSGASSSFDADDDVDMSTIIRIGGLVTGFSAEIGIPAAYRGIYQFVFLYIPFVIFLLSIYFSLPIIH